MRPFDSDPAATMGAEGPAPGPNTIDLLTPAADIGRAIVLFVDAAGNKALECLWGELEDTDALFARARIAEIISKKTRLLEVTYGDEVILIQK